MSMEFLDETLLRQEYNQVKMIADHTERLGEEYNQAIKELLSREIVRSFLKTGNYAAAVEDNFHRLLESYNRLVRYTDRTAQKTVEIIEEKLSHRR